MSFFGENKSINGIKSQKDIILEKIHKIKSFNNNIIRENFPFNKNNTNINISSPFHSQEKIIEYNTNPISEYKRVFKRPVVKKNKNDLSNNIFKTNNYILNKNNYNNLNNSNIQKLNNNIFDLNENNTNDFNIHKIIINNDNSMNETISDNEAEKFSKFYNNHIIKAKTKSYNFFTLNSEKGCHVININNNIKNLTKKNTTELNHIILKETNDNKENIKPNINKNSINTLSNINLKSDNSSHFKKIYSLSNEFLDIENRNKKYNFEENKTNITFKNKNIVKKLKKKILLKNSKTEIENEIYKTNDDYYPSKNDNKTIIPNNPFSKIEEIEINGLYQGNNKIKTDKIKKLNYLETKREILNSIEREKKKLMDESFKNYKKYLFLLKKQQQEYKEYDQFLKNELNINQNNQIKLQIFKDKLENKKYSNFNLLKTKKLKSVRHKDVSPYDNKTTSSKVFDTQKSIIKNFILANKDLYNKKRIISNIDGYEAFLTEGHNSNLNHNFINNYMEKNYKQNKKNILKINIENIKKLKKGYKKNKTKSNINNKNNNINNNKNIKNKINIIKKNKKSINNINCIAGDKKIFKNSRRISTADICLTSKNKTNYELDINFIKNKNKLSLNNVKNKLILKKLLKNLEIEKEIKYSRYKTKNSHSNLNSNFSKSNSLKKLEEINNYIEPNLSKLHKMISEEKKRILNKFNNNSLFRVNRRKNEYYSQTEISGINKYNISNLSEGKKSQNFKIKNGLYQSSLKPNKSEENSNNNIF